MTAGTVQTSYCCHQADSRKCAASHFAMYPNFDVLYFLYTPVNFPVAAL